jgi:predicted small lipoprotein YifL
MANWARSLLVLALLLAGFGLKGALLMPPKAATQVAPGEFDTNRAAARLERILGDQRPHPADSTADDAVRGRLVAELRAMGLQPQVHEATDCSAMPKTRYVSCSHVHNVIATIPSTAPGPQLLLNAHYDSTPTGPGAGDDGLGVAVLLEVGSILSQNPPPRPVILLFNEGEEFGLNGAHAFMRGPYVRRVNSLINIDNRGVTGPALMHETSDPDGAAIAIYAGATRRPYANSISSDFAKLIPNYTDVTVFKPSGWTLLDYGIIGNETRYHSPGDTTQALDRNSFAHVGTEVLSATRAMTAVLDPPRVASNRVVFTDIAGRLFLRLPLMLAATVLGGLLIAALVLAWRSRALGKPLLVAMSMVVGGSVAAGAISFIASMLRAGDFWRAYPLVPYLAIYAALLSAMAAIWVRWGRDLDRRSIRAASWLLVLVLGTAASLFLPGATIYFLIGPAVGLLGVALTRRNPELATALAIAGVVIQFVMFAELLAAVEMLLIDGPLAAGVLLAALAALPAIIETEPEGSRPAVIAMTIAAVALWLAALLIPRASAERPLGFSIDYFRDASAKTAHWAVATKQAPLPPRFPGRWEKSVLPYNGRTRWVSLAPLLSTPTPIARVIASQASGAGRRVLIALSPGGGNTVSIRFPKEADIKALGPVGAPVPIPATGEPDKPILRCTGRTCEWLQVEVVFGNKKPVEAELFSTRFGLPAEGQPLVIARPANAIPQYAPDQTITMSRLKL